MKYAVSYARVSSPDQAMKGLSIPAQFRRNDEYAKRNNIQIVYKDADEGVSAFKDNENRDAFWRCVDVACRDKRVSLFLIDDPLRFFRDRYLAVETKAELRRAGVRVVICSNPYDTSTIQGVWQEAIDEARAQTGSMETAFATIRGMEQNAMTRDAETGWCYKNGGRAPFGYKPLRVVRGQDKRGRDLIKTLWEIHPEEAEVVRFMYVECRAKKQMSYKAIQNAMNSLGMLSPTPGRPWSISTVCDMMREDRVLQCAGVYFWNKEDHRTPGRRFKPKDEWIRVDNAHPAIITMEEAEKVIAIKKARAMDRRWRRSENSDWLLIGKNILGEDLFVCLACGTRMSSYQPTRRNRRCYLCGSARYRGKDACIHKPVDKDWIEKFLLERIKETFGTREAAENIVKDLNEALSDEIAIWAKAKEKLMRALQHNESKITNLVRAVSEGFDIVVAKEELSRLQEQKADLEKRLNEIKAESQSKPRMLTPDDVLLIYQRLEDAFAKQSNKDKKKMLRCFVRKLEFNPTEDSLTVYLFAEPASTTTAVWFSSGARDGARYVHHTASKQRAT